MPRKKVVVDQNQKLSAYTVYTAKDEIDRDFGKVQLYTATYDPEGKTLSRYFDNHHVHYKLHYADYPEVRVECESLLEEAGKKGTFQLPIVVLDGRILVKPSISEVEKLLMIENTQARELYDVVIVGAGVTGVSAALTANMRGLRTLVIERTRMLSSLEETPLVQTLIDHPLGIEGQDVAFRLREALEERADVVFVEGAFAKRLKELGDLYEVSTDGAIYRTKTVILSLGSNTINFGIQGENEFIGKGVFTDPLSESRYASEKSAVLIGTDQYTYHAAIELAKHASHVTVLRAPKMVEPDPFLDTKLKEKGIAVIGPAKVLEFRGDIQLDFVKYQNTDSGKTYMLETSKVFLVRNNIHDTRWLAPVLQLAKDGRIIVENQYETSMKGVFAGGDCTREHPASTRVSQLDGAALADRVRRYVEGWNKVKGIRD